MLEVYIDGCCAPENPGGTASYGVVVFKFEEPPPSHRGDKVWESYGIVGSGSEMSNNVAEYCGLIAFLKWYLQTGELSSVGILDYESATIYSDSKLLANQMNGYFRVRAGLYVPYYREVMDILLAHGLGPRLKFQWIPREQNLADELSVKALKEVGIERRQR